MHYSGRQSLPMMRMVLQVRHALEEIGIAVPWNENGPLCELDVPRGGGSVKIRREFSAEAARLVVRTILMVPIPADSWKLIAAKLGSLDPTDDACVFFQTSGYLACTDTLEVLPDDVTPLQMGQLLDRTTDRIFLAAELVGIIEKA